MKLTQILMQSFILLRRKPKLFLPRLVTTFLYTSYFILLAYFTIDLRYLFLQSDRYLIEHMLPRIAFLLIVSIILYFIDIISYAMYSALVRDYHRGEKIDLLNALKESINTWKSLLFLGLLSFGILLIIILLLSFSIFTAFILNNLYLLLPSIFIVLFIILIFLVLMFFVIPVAIIEKKGTFQSIKESFNLGIKYRNDLLLINMFFMTLILITFLILMVTEMDIGDIVAISALFLFIIARIFQAVIYTYICVVNPYFYLVRK